MTDVRLEAFFRRLDRVAFFARDVAHVFSYPRDPKDEPYINLAVSADADYIVSRDADLLDLMSGHAAECKEFRQRFRPLQVVTPGELLTILENARRTQESG